MVYNHFKQLKWIRSTEQREPSSLGLVTKPWFQSEIPAKEQDARASEVAEPKRDLLDVWDLSLEIILTEDTYKIEWQLI